MKASIIKQMENIVKDLMTSFQSDFEKYDKNTLSDFDGEFWWCVRPNGTTLATVDYSLINNERFIYALMQNNTSLYCVATLNYNEQQLFRYSGVPYEQLVPVTKEELQQRYEDFKRFALETTTVEVPKRIKCRVLFPGNAEDRARMRAYLKEQLQYADSIGDTTLRNKLHFFHHCSQVCKDHVYYLNVDTFYGIERSFYFSECINGEHRSNGGIIYDKDTKQWSRHT